MPRIMLVVVFFVALLPLASASAQADQCFPETNHCLSGRFQQYWQQNGGLPVFGYPITDTANEVNRDTGQTYATQWLERNRFEAHPENVAPYDVLLGRLGDDELRAQGRDWQAFPKASPSAAHYYAQTGHAIAEVFWLYWSSHGLDFDGRTGTSEAESLALFGLPISEPAIETNSSGDTILTQWFERARFEDHGAKGVLLGLLGNEVHGNTSPAPIPEPTSPPPPSGGVPSPSGTCAQNAPTPAEGAQAWMTITSPARRSATTLCTRLIINGQPVAGAPVSGVAHYKGGPTNLGPATTGSDGVALITFSIGGATSGYSVQVNATVTTEGRSYHASTSFTPQ